MRNEHINADSHPRDRDIETLDWSLRMRHQGEPGTHGSHRPNVGVFPTSGSMGFAQWNLDTFPRREKIDIVIGKVEVEVTEFQAAQILADLIGLGVTPSPTRTGAKHLQNIDLIQTLVSDSLTRNFENQFNDWADDRL